MVEVCPKTLIIRADANIRMGTGHIMRCIALGQAWQDEGGEVRFFTHCDNLAILQRLHDENFKVHILNTETAFQSEIINLRSSIACSWLVLDGYHFDLKCQQAVRQSGYKLLLIDDYNHFPEYEADILLSQDIGAEQLDYHVNPQCRKLTGTRYVLLRREFQALEREKKIFPAIGKNVLVTLGGADPDNVTLKVIESLQQTDVPGLHAKIIIGPANPHFESLRRAVASSPVNCELISPVHDMTVLMKWADVAVSAAGSTCWELCCTETPFMILVLADNQQRVATGLTRLNIVKNLGGGDGVEPLKTAESLTSLLKDPVERERMSLAGGRLADGLGAERVVRQLIENAGCTQDVESNHL